MKLLVAGKLNISIQHNIDYWTVELGFKPNTTKNNAEAKSIIDAAILSLARKLPKVLFRVVRVNTERKGNGRGYFNKVIIRMSFVSFPTQAEIRMINDLRVTVLKKLQR